MTAKIIPISLSIPMDWSPARAKEHWDGFYKAANPVCEVLPGDILALASLVDAWWRVFEGMNRFGMTPVAKAEMGD